MGKTGLNPTDSHFEIPSTSVAQTSAHFTRRRAGPPGWSEPRFPNLLEGSENEKREEEGGRVNEKSSETNKPTEKEIPRLERLNEERATRWVKRYTTSLSGPANAFRNAAYGYDLESIGRYVSRALRGSGV